MFDTVHFWIDRGSIAKADVFAILPYLDDVTQRQNNHQGYSCNGKIGAYSVSVFESGISLIGSLAKYYLPSNLYTLTRQSAAEAIQQMSDNLHIDLNKAKITRLDISTVIPTKRPPKDYYKYLGNKPYFERVQATADTLYYNTAKKRLVFYDKTKEAKAKGAVIPSTLTGSHLLRYEMRYTKSIQKQLNMPEIRGKTLTNEDFYYLLVQEWKKEFEAINKIKNNFSIMTKNIKTPKEAKDAILGALLQQQGGQDLIETILADLRADNTFDDPKYYSRLKSDLNKVIDAGKEAKNELIKELEISIQNIANYAR